MDIPTIIQIFIAAGIFNVWLLRFNRETDYRPKGAKTLAQEFERYGFSRNLLLIIGGLKLLFASLLIAGVWHPQVTIYAAAGLVIMMAGAVAMHMTVGDPWRKSIPAALMLTLSLLVVFQGVIF
jgi:uncharacterized membrane protein YphA (DoxX/SURF4 family)